jgi:predicted MFS family arabinose efflux permease
VSPAAFRPLGQRDFALLWTGQTISLFGDGILSVALAWQVLKLSSSPAALAGVLLARSVPRVVLLVVGGAISDRVSRRLVLLSSDLVQGFAVAIVAVLGATGQLELWELAVLGAVTGAGSAFFLPASTAVIPQLISPDLLMAANSLSSSSRLLAEQLLGPALGGVLVAAVGTTWAFGLDAASFLVSVVTLVMIRARPEVRSETGTVLGAVREGFSYARSRPWIWITLISVGTVGNFLAYGPLPVLLPLLVRGPLSGGPTGLGLVFASLGLGGLVAAGLFGTLGQPRRKITSMYAGWGLSCIALAGLYFAPSVAIAMVLMLCCGFAGEGAQLVWVTLLQELVPEAMLGRIVAMDWLVSLGLQPAGIAFAAPAAAILGPGGVFLAGGLTSAGAVALGLFRPGVRDPELQ